MISDENDDPYLSEDRENRRAIRPSLQLGTKEGFNRMLNQRPSKHKVISGTWHGAMAVGLTVFAIGAWVGWIYHEKAMKWDR